MLAYALAGTGAGLGLRGLSAAGEIFRPRPAIAASPLGGPTTVSLTSEQDRKRPGAWVQPSLGGRPTLKLAQQATAPPLSGPANAIYDNVVKPLGLHQAADMPFTNITNPYAKPGYRAGTVMAAAGGLAGGYTFLDWLLKKKRTNELNSEVGSAEREYLDAIKGLRQTKYAAVEAMHKQAETDPLIINPVNPAGWTSQNAANLGGYGLSTWGGVATLAGIPAAAAGYHLARENSNARSLREALLLRARNLQRARPAPVVLTRPEGELEQAA